MRHVGLANICLPALLLGSPRASSATTHPFGPPPKIKKLKGKGIGQWRLELWPYRVRDDIIKQEVILYRVRHRKDIYRE